MKTLVKNGLVITFIHEGYHSIKMKYADVLIEDGAFLDIREEIADSEAEVVDAQGLWVLPGLEDMPFVQTWRQVLIKRSIMALIWVAGAAVVGGIITLIF